MKATQGFLSEDGTFFISKAECELYEAELVLDAVCDSHRVDPTAYKAMIRRSTMGTRRYINAFETCEKEIAVQSGQSDAASVSAPSDAGPEAITARLLELSSGSSEHVPEMGGGERTEGVSTEGEGVRVGSGASDASSVRGSEDLATDPPTEARTTRSRFRKPYIRE